MNLGFGELLLIFIVILLIFGASKLPQLGDALGKGIKNFKRSVSGNDEIDVTPKKDAIPDSKATPKRSESKAPQGDWPTRLPSRRRAWTRTSAAIVKLPATSRRS